MSTPTETRPDWAILIAEHAGDGVTGRRLISQLVSLERRVARSGKDSVDHPRGGHDDVINAAALALVGAALTPMSSADGWIEYLRREVERHGMEFDDVRNSTPPAFGWSFGDGR